MLPQRILQVGELTSLIRADLEEDPLLQDVYVEAEIGTSTKSAAGHRYLTLNDCREGGAERASIRAVLFRGAGSALTFEPETGRRVIAHGRVSVYAARGEMQLYLDRLEPTGVGALALAFQQLVAKLEAEGLFRPERKRPIPFLPRRVAVVTSPRGAAVRDVIHVISRRCPITELVVVPTLVQGDGSVAELVAALALAALSGADLVLLVRGGGSLEDLQAFNTEEVARAVAGCPIPVMTGVGHETDTTVVDFVADRRAPTPSAAAELAVPDLEALRLDLAGRRLRLRRGAAARLLAESQRVGTLAGRLERMAPRVRVLAGRQDLDRSLARLEAAWSRLVERHADRLGARLRLLEARGPLPRLRRAEEELGGRSGRLGALSPLAVLERGYSITWREAGQAVVRDAGEVAVGEALVTQLARGRVRSRVTAVDPQEEDASDGE